MLYKVYGRISFLEENHTKISQVLHSASVKILNAPTDKRFHRFLALEEWQIVAPSDRSFKFIQIEVIMFSGRTTETRKSLLRELMENLSKELEISSTDVEIVIIESPRENWGIRGMNGDDLSLPYKVEL
eukprot:TRINITY_DN11475_c0_g1_i1.p1 TRINITY_DN11475_c0_g1~~TRINITY_DN11475_c0_g1_i1.p1  ORF type:complete len:129 (+),score=38.22 TRINITY_DN11475_c0_g1_i1:45-431(+)